jgi:ribosomal-protein-alanine N-acetyltransferase
MAILLTERVVLRPFRREDVDLVAALMANPEFMRFSTGVRTHEETEAFLDKIVGWQDAGLPSLFAVTMQASLRLVGYCGFLHWVIDEKPEIEIGYRLHPDYWNQGIMTESARAVRDHAFRDLKLVRVISLIHPENTPSRRVAEKIGMTLEKETIFRGFPTNVFALSREVWSANYDV